MANNKKNQQNQRPAVPAGQHYAPVVITIVYDPNSGAVAVTPSFETSANALIHVQQKALQQTIAFVAVENARRESQKATNDAPPKPEK